VSILHYQSCGAALEALATSCPFCGAQPVLGDRYEIRAAIGHGGMGEVFLAYDRRLANEVAIKRLTPQFSSSPELRESLTKEARMMARLSDAGIVRLFDLANLDDDLYLVMEYVCGPSLRDMIRAGYKALPVELARVMGAICQGLGVAHRQGVIHRDLKPSNLLLALDGVERMAFAESKALPKSLANAQVKIADFGIAKALADSGTTLTNAFSGTPGYMAPEQFRGEAPTPETDVYALGAIICELLTGKLPAQPLRNIEGVHPAVTQVVAKAMSPARERRFHSAAELHEALCEAIEGRSPYPAPLRPARPGLDRRQRLLLLTALLAAVVGVAIPLATLKTRKISPVHVEPPARDEPAAIEWHSPRRVSELPPVVEAARGRLPEKGLTGPRKARIKWSLTLPISSLKIVAMGIDSTVYVSGMMSEGLCAIRDGKVAWALSAGLRGPSNVQFDADGRIWFEAEDSVYCLNRDGKGGRLPASFHAPKERRSNPYNCYEHTLSGPGWKLDLDGNCASAGVKTAPDGSIYVATDSPEILAVSANGAPRWRHQASCNAASMVAPLPNRIVYACEDRSLHGLADGVEKWRRTTNGVINREMFADAAGTIYFGEYGKLTGMSSLRAMDAQGADRWSIEMQRSVVDNMALDGQQQLYVTGSFLHTRLVCLGE
jgi:serine/threonine protein kinase